MTNKNVNQVNTYEGNTVAVYKKLTVVICGSRWIRFIGFVRGITGNEDLGLGDTTGFEWEGRGGGEPLNFFLGYDFIK